MKKLQNEDSVRKLYRVWSKAYDWFINTWNNIIAKGAEKDLDIFGNNKLKGKIDVLDLACGTGVNIVRLQRWKAAIKSYTAVDLTPEMQNKAKKKAKGIKKTKFIIDDITRYGTDKKFDLIISTMVLSHLDEPGNFIKKYLHNLRVGGYMVLLFQGEVENKSLNFIVNVIAGLFNSRLVSSEYIKKFPKPETHKKYIKGYLRLLIYKK